MNVMRGIVCRVVGHRWQEPTRVAGAGKLLEYVRCGRCQMIDPVSMRTRVWNRKRRRKLAASAARRAARSWVS